MIVKSSQITGNFTVFGLPFPANNTNSIKATPQWTCVKGRNPPMTDLYTVPVMRKAISWCYITCEQNLAVVHGKGIGE